MLLANVNKENLSAKRLALQINSSGMGQLCCQ